MDNRHTTFCEQEEAPLEREIPPRKRHGEPRFDEPTVDTRTKAGDPASQVHYSSDLTASGFSVIDLHSSLNRSLKGALVDEFDTIAVDCGFDEGSPSPAEASTAVFTASNGRGCRLCTYEALFQKQ